MSVLLPRGSRFQAESPELINWIRGAASPLDDSADLDPLMERIGDARYVLLGEASHGTSEFYSWRAHLTRRLILEKGFSFIAVEGDWPDCYRVNCFVKGASHWGNTAHSVLFGFDRWPTWMWANREIEELATWLREHNDAQAAEHRVGFYGLDVYSLWDSMKQVSDYLEGIDPETARLARWAYGCFEPYQEDVQEYAHATRWVPTSCEHEVVMMLTELRRHANEYREQDGAPASEAYFNAEQNALVTRNAERYYRAMVRGGASSWNVRDQHMADTLDRLMQHHGPHAKCIVWEHNTHIGDARATDMVASGMMNIGQLVRESHAEEGVVLVGFGTHRGSVIAGEAWEAPMQRMRVPPAQEDSWEHLFHEAGAEDRLLVFEEGANPPSALESRGHRAIGVVYDPRHERWGNYVPTVLPQRYDAFLFLDRTEALHPLHLVAEVSADAPETYPTGV